MNLLTCHLVYVIHQQGSNHAQVLGRSGVEELFCISG